MIKTLIDILDSKYIEPIEIAPAFRTIVLYRS